MLDGIENECTDDRARSFQGDRNREVRYPSQEIQGAVDRVDDPPVFTVARLLQAFLHEKTVAGPRARKLAVQDFLGS